MTAELARRKEVKRLEASLIEFFKAAWPTFDPAVYVHGWHLEAIAEHLQAVSAGTIRKLLINVPPRHSKTLLASVAWPVWTWACAAVKGTPLIGPQVKFLCLSYSDQLALDNATTARRLIESDWFQVRWGRRVKITGDQDAKNKFDNTAGGTRISSSFGGTVTGRGGDIKIIDDPHKMDEVESDTIREGVIRTYNTTLKSRITDPRHSAEVTICQRGHEADLSDLLLNDPEVVHLNLPAEYDSKRHCVTVLDWHDPREADGELLWPRRFGQKELVQFKANPFEWSAQWQQEPRPRGGNILNPNWWRLWGKDEAVAHGLEWNDDEDENGKPTGRREFPDCQFVIASLDTAFTSKQENDASALTVWGVWRDRHGVRKLMLLFAWADRLELHNLVQKVAATCRKYRVDRLLIEAKTAGHSVAQEIARLYDRERWGVQLINPGALDKVARAHSVVQVFVDGTIYAPNTSWAQDIINECASFRKGAHHDDRVDSVTMAVRWLRDNGLLERTEEAKGLIDDAMAFKPKSEPLYPGV